MSSEKITVKYRVLPNALPPRPIKLSRPDWSGNLESGDDAIPQPWHCMPFVEGSTYGLELIYPYEECKILNECGDIKFIGDNALFASFSPMHYGFTSSLDIDVGHEFCIRLEPHPRFFTDSTGEYPIVVPGHIQSWWSHIFFVVFKSPLQGQTHVFRKNEPFGQILIVPRKMSYEINQMTFEEARARNVRENRISKLGRFISKNSWRDYKGNVFDDKYKVLSSAYSRDGYNGIDKVLEKAEQQQNKPRNIKKKFFIEKLPNQKITSKKASVDS